MNLRYVYNSISLILRYFSILLLIPCICALVLKEYNSLIPFLCAALLSFLLGLLLHSKNHKNEEINNINRTEAFAIVLMAWGLICLIGVIPFLYFGLKPIDALFESVSGITTTGATILKDFSLYPQTMFFWRSFSQWLGGLGIIVLFAAILPKFSIAGRQMVFAEIPGSKDSQLTPRIRQTAAVLWSIYFFLTLIECGILIYLKIPVFDAICTSLSTVSGGGFSPKAESLIYAYGMSKIVWVIAVFMFIAGINFTLQYKVFVKRKILSLFKDEEFRIYFLIVALFTVFIAVTLTTHHYYDFKNSIKAAFFQVVTIISTTGFASVDYSQWCLRAKVLLFMLMFTGASIGSASGGVKLLRIILIFKYLKRQISKIHHPNGVYPIKINKVIVHEDVVRQMISFVFFFYAIFVITAVLLVIIEQDVITGLSAAIATISNLGPGMGNVVGPMGSYSDLHTLSKIITIFNMFVGRLELIPFLAILHPDFWNIKKINNLQKNK